MGQRLLAQGENWLALGLPCSHACHQWKTATTTSSNFANDSAQAVKGWSQGEDSDPALSVTEYSESESAPSEVAPSDSMDGYSEDFEKAEALGPIYSRECLGKRAMIFENTPAPILAEFGHVQTPSVGDLFLAKME